MEGRRIVIIGAGAVGGCIGGLLCHSSHDVVLVARGEHGQIIRDAGLQVRFPNRTLETKVACVPTVQEVDWSHHDVCMIATKLNDAEAVMDEVVVAAGNSVPVVCAFNGLQGEKWAAERFLTVASVVIWMPSTHLFAGDVRVYGKDCPGVLDIGPIQGDDGMSLSRQISDLLRSAGFDSEVRDNILDWRYAKLITNLGNTAQALVTDDWVSVLKAAQSEGEDVLNAAKIKRVATTILLERCRNIQLDKIDGERRAGGSTWQSMQRGKALETRWIEGEIVKLAESSNLSAPVNKKLCELAESRTPCSVDQILSD